MKEGSQIYNVLLILTDGIIVDMWHARQRLVELAALPCSVIIVGLGKDDFTDMKVLDGDDERLTDYDGKQAVRDIVQFVEYNDAVKAGELGEQLMDEIPTQVVEYMKANNIKVSYL